MTLHPGAGGGGTLSAVALLALGYGFLCSGPYGVEPAVGAAGCLYAVIGLLLFAAVWALPQALVAAELTTAMPSSGSVVLWMERGAGRRWAAVGAGCIVLSQMFDLAIWPGQVVGYAGQLYPPLQPGTPGATVVQVVLVAAVGAANLAGVSVVAHVALASLVVTVGPFVVLPAVALVRGVPWDAAAIVAAPPAVPPAALANLASVLLWTYQGFYNLSNVAGSIRDPQRVYPRVLLGVAGLMAFTYAASVAVGVALVPAQAQWDVGTFAAVGEAAAPWLGQWVLVGACAANLMGGLSGLSLYAFMLQRFAASKLVPLGAAGAALAAAAGEPGCGARMPARAGVPAAAVLFFTATTLGLQFLDFTHIVATDTMLNLTGFAVMAVAFLRLRHTEPDMVRPFRVPGGALGGRVVGWVCLLFAAGMAVIVAAGEWYAIAVTAAAAGGLWVWAGWADTVAAGGDDEEDKGAEGDALLQAAQAS
jgi:amino acid transporter